MGGSWPTALLTRLCEHVKKLSVTWLLLHSERNCGRYFPVLMSLRTGDRLADQEPLQLQPWKARHLLLKDHEKRVFSRPLFVFTAVIQANLLAWGADSRGGCRVASAGQETLSQWRQQWQGAWQTSPRKRKDRILRSWAETSKTQPVTCWAAGGCLVLGSTF